MVAISTSWARCEQLQAMLGGGGALVLAARELQADQRVEGGALRTGVAHSPGQLDGAFNELARLRVAFVLKAGRQTAEAPSRTSFSVIAARS
jgi:hypothetical protein